MFCAKCGKQIPDDSAFCPECGEKLEAARPAAATAPLPPPPGVASGTEEVSQAMLIGIIVGTVIFPLLGLVMGLIFLNNANPSKKKAGKIWLIVSGIAFVFWILFQFSMAM